MLNWMPKKLSVAFLMTALLSSCGTKVIYVPTNDVCAGLKPLQISTSCSIQDMRDVAEQNIYIETACESYWEQNKKTEAN